MHKIMTVPFYLLSFYFLRPLLFPLLFPDKKFDKGKDISKYLDISKARRLKQEQKRVNVDFPLWMIQLLDKEAKRLGVPRQSIIKVWVAERLEKIS